MRISDWSSDVCSSDLVDEIGDEIALDLLRIDEMRHAELLGDRLARRVEVDADDHVGAGDAGALDDVETDAAEPEDDDVVARLHLGGIDRKSVVEGNGVSVRVVLGGGRQIKKKK